MSNDSHRPEPQWDDETWSLALSAMQRLEAAWRGPGLPSLADYVPVARDDPRYAAMLVRLIETDCQCRRRANARKEPADYLAEWPELRDRPEFAALFDETLDHNDRPAAAGQVEAVGWLQRSEPHHREPNAVLRPPPSPLQPWAFRISCPHCHQAVEIIDQDPLVQISCPSCGSSLSLVDRGVPLDRSIAGQTRIRRRIAHFELVEQLGVGAFGSVWKAKDTQLDTLVAVKIPRSGQLDAEEAERFIREARAAAQLHHAHIVGVHAVGRDGDQLYIVSELIAGRPLDEWRGGRRLGSDEAAAACAKIADALDYAHEHGVIHRDLKPQNILMDDRGRAARDRLRPGQAGGGRNDHDRPGPGPGHARLPLARAGRGPQPRGRSAVGHLFAGRDPLRAAHRRAALSRQPGDAVAPARRGRRPQPAAAGRRHSPRPGDDRSKVPGEGAAASLPVRRRGCGRVAAVFSPRSRSAPGRSGSPSSFGVGAAVSPS